LTGESADLDQAIGSARAVVDIEPRRATNLSNLSHMLRRRYEALGMREDIEEAISNQSEALRLVGPGDPHWIAMAGLLVTLLNSRFADTGNMDDIEKAISLGESLLSAPGRSARDDAHRLSNAGNVAGSYTTRYHYEMRHGREPSLSDLDRAIELGEWVVAHMPPDDTGLPEARSNLAEALHQRFGRTRQTADAMRAIRAAESAVAQTAPGDPFRAAFALNLGVAWGDYARLGGGGVDAIRAALAALAEAMTVTSGPARTRLTAARLCGEYAAMIEDWRGAVDAYRVAVEMLPRIAWRGVDRATGERLLADTDGLPGMAHGGLPRHHGPAPG
jgi:hypothetical protein